MERPFGSQVERRSIVRPTAGAGLPCPSLSRVVPCHLDACAELAEVDDHNQHLSLEDEDDEVEVGENEGEDRGDADEVGDVDPK